MSGMGMRHPEDGQLLRYLDGELPGRKTRQVRRHLEACWQCRAELEELQKTVSDCVRYRKTILATGLPPPPGPWQDLSRGFERIDAEIERGSFAGRLLRAVAPPPIRWTAAAAAALAVICALIYQWRETPPVQAAALLKKAVAAAEARPKRAHRLQIKTRTSQLTRVVGQISDLPAARLDRSGDLPHLESLFRSANYGWDDPLSARSFQAWRDGLAEKHDEVSTTEDRSSYRISTTTGDGELVAATLTLRIADFEPTEGRFEFRDREWVEMTELADLPTPPASEVAEATGGIPSKPDMPPPHLGSSPAPAGAAGIAEELQVVAALHQVGADLGDPLEIARSGGQVVVTGAGIPAERQRQIQNALESLPDVAVRFVDAAPPAAPAPLPAAGGESSRPNYSQFQRHLQEKLGGRAPFERFSSRALDRTDAAMTRAYALRRLAQEFPPESERELTREDRQLLRGMAREHLAALAAAAGEIDAAVSPVLPSMSGPGASQDSGVDGAWQTTAEELLRAGRQVERSLAALLGVAPAENGADPPSRFAAGMRELKAGLERCQRLLSYDDVGQRK